MRLLIINFELDRLSRAMPYTQQIVNLLAERCEQVVVMTGHVGSYDRPSNVRVELIPARPWGVPQRLGGKYLVNWLAYRLMKQHRLDACFIHMAADWSSALRPAFRLAGIPVLLWFAHGVVTPATVRAVRAADRVVTASPESCRVEAGNIRVIGHGIDTEMFNLTPPAAQRNSIISVNRITPRKRIELLIEVAQALKRIPDAPEIELQIIGTTAAERDQPYEHTLREQIWDLGLEDTVHFTGYVPQRYLSRFYERAFCHLHVSQTGSVDKAPLESLACGCPVLTSNEAFFDLLKDYPDFIIHDDSPQAIASQVANLYYKRDEYNPQVLRNLVVGHHDVYSYIGKVMANLEELVAQRKR